MSESPPEDVAEVQIDSADNNSNAKFDGEAESKWDILEVDKLRVAREGGSRCLGVEQHA